MSSEQPRKRRSDAFENDWPDEDVMTLRDGLLGPWGYEEAKAWIIERGHPPASNGALSRFWEHYCQPVLRERRRTAARKAEAIIADSMSDAVGWDEAASERLNQLTFEFLLDSKEEIDTKDVARLYKLILSDRALKNDAKRLALLEEKAADARKAKEQLAAAVKGVRDGGLSKEALAEIEEAANLL